MYRRLVKGLNQKGELIPYTDNIYDHVTNLKKDHYLSVCLYNEKQRERFYTPIEKTNIDTGEVYKTINGAAGIDDVVTDKLVFDFDVKDGNLEAARKDTLEVIARLNSYGVESDDIEITFSGNKGFGLVVNLDESITPDEHKDMALGIAGDLDTTDFVIYNPSRVLRVPCTKHQDSKLFKTYLSSDELKTASIDDIKQWSKEEFIPDDAISFPKIKLPKEIKAFKNKKEVPKETVEFGTENLYDKICTLDFSKKPKWLSHWKYALSNGYFPSGMRNYSLLILGATYAGQGFNKATTYRMLKGAAELQSERFGQDRFPDEEIWKNIIGQIYGGSWTGGTYSEDNFPEELQQYLDDLGIERTPSDDDDNRLVEVLGEGFDVFAEYARTINEHTIKTGIHPLDEKLKIRAGHLVFILAPPSVGKTSALVSILNHTSKMGIQSYFSSLDMYRLEVYKKLIQKHTRMSEDQIFDAFVKGDVELITRFRNILKEEYENVNLSYKSGESVSDMRRSIESIEAKTGKKIDLVAVDYLELVLTEAGDPTAATAEAAQKLRELANEGRVVICLLQPNKHNSHPNEPITSFNGAKGSSSIAQACSAFLTLHRPGMDSTNDNVDDNFMGINCVKNRNGPLFSLDLAWDGKTQTISELDDSGRAELKRLRQRQKEEKEQDDGWL